MLAVGNQDGRTYRHDGDVHALSASRGMMDLDYAVPGTSAIAVALGESLAQSLEFLFHEAFHVFQARNFVKTHVLEINTSLIASASQIALWEVERMILREALATDQESAIRALLLSYLAVRARRSEHLPRDVAEYEAQLERVERVIDPTKVTRTALQNASSIAGLLLTTEAVVTEKPEKQQAGGGGGGGGMPGGMGDMY